MDAPDAPDDLAEVVLELTDTLGEAFDTGALLHDLATAMTRFLDVDAAAVLLFDASGRLAPVAGTDVGIDRVARLQVETGAGPVPELVRARSCSYCPDLEDPDQWWAGFARQARGTGFRAVHAGPMGVHGDLVGGVLLFRRGAGVLSDADRRTAGLLATAAATGLVHRRAVHELETVNGQLRLALSSRVAIEQAKGFLVARLGVTPEAAFGVLRDHARRRRQRLTIIAEAVVDRRLELT